MNRFKKSKSFKTEQHLTAVLVSVLSTVALIALGGYKKFKNFIKCTNPLRVFDSFKSDMDETMKMPEDAFKERELVKLLGGLNSRKVFLSFFFGVFVYGYLLFFLRLMFFQESTYSFCIVEIQKKMERTVKPFSIESPILCNISKQLRLF